MDLNQHFFASGYVQSKEDSNTELKDFIPFRTPKISSMTLMSRLTDQNDTRVAYFRNEVGSPGVLLEQFQPLSFFKLSTTHTAILKDATFITRQMELAAFSWWLLAAFRGISYFSSALTYVNMQISSCTSLNKNETKRIKYQLVHTPYWQILIFDKIPPHRVLVHPIQTFPPRPIKMIPTPHKIFCFFFCHIVHIRFRFPILVFVHIIAGSVCFMIGSNTATIVVLLLEKQIVSASPRFLLLSQSN